MLRERQEDLEEAEEKRIAPYGWCVYCRIPLPADGSERQCPVRDPRRPSRLPCLWMDRSWR